MQHRILEFPDATLHLDVFRRNLTVQRIETGADGYSVTTLHVSFPQMPLWRRDAIKVLEPLLGDHAVPVADAWLEIAKTLDNYAWQPWHPLENG